MRWNLNMQNCTRAIARRDSSHCTSEMLCNGTAWLMNNMVQPACLFINRWCRRMMYPIQNTTTSSDEILTAGLSKRKDLMEWAFIIHRCGWVLSDWGFACPSIHQLEKSMRAFSGIISNFFGPKIKFHFCTRRNQNYKIGQDLFPGNLWPSGARHLPQHAICSHLPQQLETTSTNVTACKNAGPVSTRTVVANSW